MKEFTLQITDSAYACEPEMWENYLKAMQQALNRMVVGYMKYRADRFELFMDCEEDKVAFIRQRTDKVAEEEIRLVFGQVAEEQRRCYPNLYQDMSGEVVDGFYEI